MITRERAIEAFIYDPELGTLRNRTTRRGGARAGEIAGCVNPDGYLQVKIDYQTIKVHTIVWLIVHGEYIPLLDHKDRDTFNNRDTNLRPCTVAQNAMNKRARYSSTSGRKGVHWETARHCWYVCIGISGKSKFLGRFHNLAKAQAAYAKAAHEHFGEFARVT
jgi:hypothetical protein